MDTILLTMYSIEQCTDIIITHVQWYWIHTCYITMAGGITQVSQAMSWHICGIMSYLHICIIVTCLHCLVVNKVINHWRAWLVIWYFLQPWLLIILLRLLFYQSFINYSFLLIRDSHDVINRGVGKNSWMEHWTGLLDWNILVSAFIFESLHLYNLQVSGYYGWL